MSLQARADLNQLPVNTQFWRYVVPSIAGMLVVSSNVLIDGIFVGRYVGAHALAAITLVYPIVMLQIGLGAMISMGAATRISILQGAGQVVAAKQTLANTLIMIALLGIALPAIGISQLEHILVLLNADNAADVLHEARAYLRLMLWGGVVNIGQIAAIFLIRNDGQPKLATLLVAFSALSNIALNYLFLVHFQLGLAGAAMATLLVEGFITLAGLLYFFSPLAHLRLALADLRADWASMPAILGLGFSSLLMEANLALLMFAHNYQLLEYGKGNDVAAYAIAAYTEAVFILLIHGLAMGMQPLLSHATGAKDAERLVQILRYGLRVSVVIGVCLLATVQLFPATIAALYVGNDPVLIALATDALRWHLFALPFDGILIVGVIALQAMALTRLAMVGTLGKTLLLIPALWLMPQWWGVTGIYTALPLVNMLLGSIIGLVLWQQLRRLRKTALE
ncbi:MATE family efflux transporter [Deefgea salmonis]|uniref:Multidrug export protein MepA n=1 Tax=Deefgea salmonis TaxID=2875502 RepID=A0ABS8BLK3_9NEIS|nr:MATE family efflux transporter [Deefgea salmonis]MCB5196492.1 MATE family efflux transporter [Deefgea salmonis]